MKKMIFALLCVMAFAFAIQPAQSWTVVSTGKYSANGGANVTTEGGNVTNLNLAGNVSTEKWAGFWGNVTGRIVLSPGTGTFYSWTWTPANGGEVCAVDAASGFNWAGITTTTASAINTAWSFVGGADNATTTLAGACNVKVAGITVSGSVGNKTGVGGFETCAVYDGAGAAKGDYAFCVNMTSAGNLFNGATGDYELLVPTNEAEATYETYYFWLDLA